MPSTLSMTTELTGVSAAEFWSLRRDRGYDRFCAARREGATFTLHSETEEVDENGDAFWIVESAMAYERSSLPTAMQGFVKKDEPFRMWIKCTFWAEIFNESHVATFEMRPSVLGDKLVVSGDCWCEQAADRSCRLHTRHSVHCRLFPIGSLVERVLLSQMETSYQGLAALTTEYMSTDEYAAFQHQQHETRHDAEAMAAHGEPLDDDASVASRERHGDSASTAPSDIDGGTSIRS